MFYKLKNKFIVFAFKATKRLKLPFKSNRLLIVRPDAIGDYILFRNFIPVLKQHPVWGKYKFTLLGNKSFKVLAENVDAAYIDEFIWIDRNYSLREYYSLCMLAMKLKFKKFDVLINPVHSREAFIDEFCFATGSKYLIASSGDSFLFKNENKKIFYDQLYTRLIPALDIFNFEFIRNRFFFKNLCNNDTITRTFLSFKKSELVTENCYNIIIVPGAGSELRRWSPENFASLIQLINTQYESELNIRFFIIGTKADKQKAETIQQKNNATNISDLTAKTTLVEVIDLIGNANLVISNETSSVHIAAAINTPAICITNGDYFGRFYPYPPEISSCIQTVYPEGEYNSKYNNWSQFVEKPSDVDINQIKPEVIFKKVMEKLEKLILT